MINSIIKLIIELKIKFNYVLITLSICYNALVLIS